MNKGIYSIQVLTGFTKDIEDELPIKFLSENKRAELKRGYLYHELAKHIEEWRILRILELWLIYSKEIEIKLMDGTSIHWVNHSAQEIEKP